MTNTRIAAPTYRRLKERRDRLAKAADRQVTITEVLEGLLDIADAADDLEQPARGRHAAALHHDYAAAPVTEWVGLTP